MTLTTMHNPYDHIAGQWHSSPKEQGYADRVLAYVDEVLEGLPSRAKVLDLGCGTGRLIAEHIVRLSYRVVGVDGCGTWVDQSLAAVGLSFASSDTVMPAA